MRPINWDDFRKCAACGAEIGQACRSRSGHVVEGRPDGVEIQLEQPHQGRKRRAGKVWPINERADAWVPGDMRFGRGRIV